MIEPPPVVVPLEGYTPKCDFLCSSEGAGGVTYLLRLREEMDTKVTYHLKKMTQFQELDKNLRADISKTIAVIPELPKSGSRMGFRRRMSALGASDFSQNLFEGLRTYFEEIMCQIPSVSAVPNLRAFFTEQRLSPTDTELLFSLRNVVRDNLSLETIEGYWKVPGSQRIWFIEETGRCLLDGKHRGEQFDLHQTGTGLKMVISRTDGWQIDLERSNEDLLIWTRPGTEDEELEWEREDDDLAEAILDDLRRQRDELAGLGPKRAPNEIPEILGNRRGMLSTEEFLAGVVEEGSDEDKESDDGENEDGEDDSDGSALTDVSDTGGESATGRNKARSPKSGSEVGTPKSATSAATSRAMNSVPSNGNSMKPLMSTEEFLADIETPEPSPRKQEDEEDERPLRARLQDAHKKRRKAEEALKTAEAAVKEAMQKRDEASAAVKEAKSEVERLEAEVADENPWGLHADLLAALPAIGRNQEVQNLLKNKGLKRDSFSSMSSMSMEDSGSFRDREQCLGRAAASDRGRVHAGFLQDPGGQ